MFYLICLKSSVFSANQDTPLCLQTRYVNESVLLASFLISIYRFQRNPRRESVRIPPLPHALAKYASSAHDYEIRPET